MPSRKNRWDLLPRLLATTFETKRNIAAQAGQDRPLRSSLFSALSYCCVRVVCAVRVRSTPLLSPFFRYCKSTDLMACTTSFDRLLATLFSFAPSSFSTAPAWTGPPTRARHQQAGSFWQALLVPFVHKCVVEVRHGLA